jgi:predicted dehydrogenase
MNRKLRMGMVGGGPGAFIGEVHRKAARMDGGIEVVAGAFHIDPKLSHEQGRLLCIDPARAYDNFEQMLEKEAKREDKVDFIAVTTPNNWHFPIAKACLQAGFNVMCEKPMTMTLKEAKDLQKIVEKSGKVFGLMHNYPGYPMAKLARDMVRQGDLGKIYKIVVQYPQGWLVRAIEKTGQQQASWRTDPKQSGAAGCMGDIGTHAENMAHYITGLEIEELCADLTTFIEGRRLDDDGNVLVRWSKGCKGILHASQVSIGEENGLAIWVYGENKALEWHQEHPNYLYVKVIDGPVQVWRRGNGYVSAKSAAAGRATRIPSGHPEAFLEAFANNYVNFADTIRAKIDGRKPTELELDFPGVKEGITGMAFIESVVKSSALGAKWVKFPKV